MGISVRDKEEGAVGIETGPWPVSCPRWHWWRHCDQDGLIFLLEPPH